MTATDPDCLCTAICPSCPPVPVHAAGAVQGTRVLLSVPDMHCAGCISKVERSLNAMPNVRDARVNLTLKRADVTVTGDLGPADLIEKLEETGFEAHELDSGALKASGTDRAGRDLLMRLGVAAFASMNVMLLSVAVWSGAEDATRDVFHWVSALIALPAIAFSAQPFFRNAWSALRVGRMNMDVPIVLAILLAVGTSLYETANHGEHAYFDAALTLVLFLLAGRYLDYRTRAAARSAAEELAALEVSRAVRLTEAGEETVALSELVAGDHILVRPGGRMPVDGVVTEGKSEVDRSLLTGETLPAFAGPGSEVRAGEVNLTGPLTLRATAVGKDSSLFALTDLVAVAESGRSRYSSLADKAARLYAPGVHILAALSFAGWYVATQDFRTAINIAAAVLIITCPCALGLAVPAVTTAASGRLFRHGMLIKSATALERLAEVDVAVFDKTGTLTTGDLVPVNLEARSTEDRRVALALAQASGHPMAKALVQALETTTGTAAVEDIQEVPGYGVQGVLDGDVVRLGRVNWVGGDVSETPLASTWLQIGSRAPVSFLFQDTLRTGAQKAVADLQAQGVQVRLVSGDAAPAVAAIAKAIGISDWQAGALPEDKAAIVNQLASDGHRVLMVGDGLNDTAALAAAHVSISPASALDAARVASDIVLLGTDLSPVGLARETAQKATRRIRENFRIATVYNVLAVPLAVAGLATPLIAALAMSSSSITVSLNALRVGRSTGDKVTDLARDPG